MNQIVIGPQKMTSWKSLVGSFSQTLFFGGDKRRPEIRLRSQANCLPERSRCRPFQPDRLYTLNFSNDVFLVIENNNKKMKSYRESIRYRSGNIVLLIYPSVHENWANIDVCASHLLFQNISISKCVSYSPSSRLLLTSQHSRCQKKKKGRKKEKSNNP